MPESGGGALTSGLHHIALGARDPERVAAFYRDFLGLREVRRHFEPDGSVRSVWLDLCGPLLMVERTGKRARRVQGVGAGPFLVAFAVGKRQRAALERSLSGAGIRLEPGTVHTTYFRDPEGNRVAISSYPRVRSS